jgi:hypothetical protein
LNEFLLKKGTYPFVFQIRAGVELQIKRNKNSLAYFQNIAKEFAGG